MFDFLKKLILLLISIVLILTIFLGLSSVARDFVFTRVIHAYNLYQVMSLRQLVRNRDFSAAAEKIMSQINASNRLSSNRSQLIVGIEESIDFVTDKVMIEEDMKLFKPALKELLKIDPEWYKVNVLLARSIGDSEPKAALKNIDRAINIVESNEDAYRVGIKLSYQNQSLNLVSYYCDKYQNAQLGGVVPRSFNRIFIDGAIDKIALSFNQSNKEDKIYINDGLILNKTTDYEFIPNTPLKSEVISLFFGLPSGIKIEILDIFINSIDANINILGKDILMVSKKSFVNYSNDSSLEIFTTGSDDRLDFFIPNDVSGIKKVTFRMNFSKLPLASQELCKLDE
jgi:hypothetical protein